MGLQIFKVVLVRIFFSFVRLSKHHVHGAVKSVSQQMSTCGLDLVEDASFVQTKSDALLQVTHARVSGEAVFLVGNGVLTEQERDMLVNAPAHKVYRFNGMPGLRKSEPVGNVFVRSFSGAAGGYWGLSCCNDQNASCHWGAAASTMCSRISEAVSVVLLGGSSSKADNFVRSCSDAVPIASKILDQDVVYLDGKKRATPTGYLYGWSSGFLGFVHLRTVHPHDDIHIMGMNWASAIKRQPHPFTVEHSIISETTGVSVRIHETGTDVYHDTNVTVCECSETQVANSIVDERGIQKVASDVAATCSHGGSLL
eukprot:TRINITY_DN2331_c0_g1_i5.p1 TRINITY_DN2331_c0_g1~~TRINITY_DN2331_c0_g1_i5.p1  ORF type:complete len:312 (-),score=41.80 TRINITY_DN2331_c0_g1_i5:174-1109(-)